MDSHRYWTHNVHGPTALEHEVAHASVTDLRDKLSAIDMALEGADALGVSG